MARPGVEITPRKQWPTGLDRRGIDVRGRIPSEEQPAAGRAIARLTDLGHGGLLRELFTPGPDGEPVDQEVPQALIDATVAVFRDWDWERPVAVASIPSASRPTLVRSTARRIAELGRMTDLGDLELDPTIPTPRSGNSTFRVSSIWGRVRVPGHWQLGELEGPLLLVDDRVDSGWTMTVVARELLRAGAPAVLPFALALEA